MSSSHPLRSKIQMSPYSRGTALGRGQRSKTEFTFRSQGPWSGLEGCALCPGPALGGASQVGFAPSAPSTTHWLSRTEKGLLPSAGASTPTGPLRQGGLGTGGVHRAGALPARPGWLLGRLHTPAATRALPTSAGQRRSRYRLHSRGQMRLGSERPTRW